MKEYIQHEIIELTNQSGFYSIELDKRFKFCKGIYIAGATTDFYALIGVKTPVTWLLNKIPYAFLAKNFNLGKKEFYQIPFAAKANGNVLEVFFESVNYATIRQIEVSFVLTNKEPEIPKFDYLYHYEKDIVWNQTNEYVFNIEIDSFYKNVTGIAVLNNNSDFDLNQIALTFRDNLESYIYKLDGRLFECFSLPIEENFLDVEFTNSKTLQCLLYAKIYDGILNGDICIIFKVENRNKKSIC